MPGGRPTKFTQELADLICQRVANNACGLVKLCDMFDDMPAPSTIRLWKDENKQFSAQYLAAQQAKVHFKVENANDMMDSTILYYTDQHGNKRIDAPSVALAIAKANNDKWFASKIARGTYGDNQQQEQTNEKLDKLHQMVAELEAKKKDEY